MRRSEGKNGGLRPIEQCPVDARLDRVPGPARPCPARPCSGLGLVLALLVACSSSSSASTAANSTASSERTSAKPMGLAPAAGASTPQQVVQRIEPVPEAAATSAAAASAAATSSAGGTGGRGESSRPAGITARHLEAELNRLEAELSR